MREYFLQRFSPLLDLTVDTIVENNPAILPALQALSHLLSSLSGRFWTATSSHPDFVRVIVSAHASRAGSPPVQRAALEVLEHLAVSYSGADRRRFLGEIVGFVCGEEVKRALPRTLHDVCTLICARILSREMQQVLIDAFSSLLSFFPLSLRSIICVMSVCQRDAADRATSGYLQLQHYGVGYSKHAACARSF